MKRPFILRDVKAFTAWLANGGVIFEAATSEWEVLRWRVPDGSRNNIAIIYRNKKDRLRFHGRALDCIAQYQDGGPFEVVNEPQRRSLKLFTDASYRERTNSGAWAAILIIGDGTSEISGPLRGAVTSSTEAEMCAVANALHHFLKVRLIEPRDQVHLYCDNHTVVDRVNGKRPKRKMVGGVEALDKTIELANRAGIVLTAEWIKGHQRANPADPHITHNRRADQLCSIHAKQLDRDRKAEQ
jgi:ribonuclease HI